MTLANKTVLVTGGTGFIGGRLVEKLILEQHARVRVLVRNLSNASRVARFNLEMIHGDIDNSSVVEEAVKGCDVVFHCAYDFTAPVKKRIEVNVNGTEHVAKACLKHQVRMVHVSTIDVYGWPSDGKLDEHTPKNAKGNIYAESKLAVEQLVLNLYQQQHLAVTVIQPTIIYGPFSRPWTMTPAQQVKNGQVVLVNDGTGFCNAVYIDDVVDALFLAATKEEALGETFLISASEPITWKEFYHAYEKVLGVENALVSLAEDDLKNIAQASEGLAGEWHLFTSLLRSQRLHTKLKQVPFIGTLYRSCSQSLPGKLKKFLKSHILEPQTATQSTRTSGAAEKPMFAPDPWKLKLYRSCAQVQIDKARRLLGYEPQFDFDRGMALTAQFLDWANFK